MAVPDVTLERLEDQIGWYDRKSAQNQRWFKTFKALQLSPQPQFPLPRRSACALPCWLRSGPPSSSSRGSSS
jgi:hypothetical protein